MEKNKIIKIIGVMLLLTLIGVIGSKYFSSEPSEFNQEKIATPSNQQSVRTPADDYDTENVQVRHLSWGKLNYYPETITVQQGKKVQLVADMDRLQGCFSSLRIPDLDVSAQFTENNNIVEFTPTEKGTFGFSCAMGMGNGELIVQ